MRSPRRRVNLIFKCFLLSLTASLAYGEKQKVKRSVSGHLDPPLTYAGHEDLPRGCISYADRYGRYIEPNLMQAMYDPNDLYPEATHVLAVKLHYGVKWQKDLVLFLLSAAHELSAAGMHMYLLVQDSSERQIGAHDTPEKFRRSLPMPLRPMLFLFHEEDVHNTYPKLHEFQQHVRDYLPFVYFLHRFPGYQFAWCMEYDIRYTGPSLAEFLQALLDIAAQKLKFKEKGSSGELEQPQEGSLHNRRDLRGTSSDPYEEEAEEAPVPDLLFIGLDLDDPVQITSDPETQPRDYDPIRWNMTHYHNRLLMLMGWSRTFAHTLHDWSVDGKGGYLEEYIPSLAYANNLTTVGILVDQFYGESFHCCFPETANRFYKEFYRFKSKCYPYALLHPIKLDDTFWETHSAALQP